LDYIRSFFCSWDTKRLAWLLNTLRLVWKTFLQIGECLAKASSLKVLPQPLHSFRFTALAIAAKGSAFLKVDPIYYLSEVCIVFPKFYLIVPL